MVLVNIISTVNNGYYSGQLVVGQMLNLSVRRVEFAKSGTRFSRCIFAVLTTLPVGMATPCLGFFMAGFFLYLAGGLVS